MPPVRPLGGVSKADKLTSSPPSPPNSPQKATLPPPPPPSPTTREIWLNCNTTSATHSHANHMASPMEHLVPCRVWC